LAGELPRQVVKPDGNLLAVGIVYKVVKPRMTGEVVQSPEQIDKS
jgi:hypothetical protein